MQFLRGRAVIFLENSKKTANINNAIANDKINRLVCSWAIFAGIKFHQSLYQLLLPGSGP